MNEVGELIIESIKFINLCQQMFLKGKLNLNSYMSLTTIKLEFLDYIFSTEKRFHIPKYYISKAVKLYSVDFLISTLNMESVGKY